MRPSSLAKLLVVAVGCATSSRAPSSEDHLLQLVEQIRQADYAGDRQALADLQGKLAAAPTGNAPRSLVLYWRGFALWRRAINGFNETPTPGDLGTDASAATREFEASLKEDPKLVDAQAALAACIGLQMYLHGTVDDEMRAMLARVKALLAEAQALEPENPRLLWVRGPMEWFTPKGSPQEMLDERQARSIATYQRGLGGLPASLRSGPEPLRPTWGEPELHMSLGWAYLKKREPDVAQAELHARKALALVPSWHYVRDILVPQIEAARTASR
ncbi:MAG TPA: hypothetical protein VGG91_11830 [Myxococcaceae bacterium]